MMRLIGIFFASTLMVLNANAGSLKDDMAPKLSWTGIYGGVHVGRGWGDVDHTSIGGAPHYFNPGQTVGFSPTDLIAGGHVGVNYQTGSLVFGVEVSYDPIKIDDTTTAVGPFSANTYETEISNLFTVVGRLGFQADRWLVYAKGGYASATIDTFQTEAPAFNHSGESGKRQSGWTIGGGVEYALTSNIIFGIEYNYVDLGSASHGINDDTPQGATETIDVDATISTALARISFKF